MMPAPKFPQYKTLIFETWPIERCIGYARNPRKNDHAVDIVARTSGSMLAMSCIMIFF